MFVIKNTLVSLDLVERFFVCDLEVCKGICCIEGDAGAPISRDEQNNIEKCLPQIIPLLTPAGKNVIENEGIAYIDTEGDLVTSLIEGRNCAFTCYSDSGICLCALEKGFRKGEIPNLKPASCSLYPVRLKKVGNMTALNFHKWKICSCAEKKGKKLGLRAYQFLKDPLIKQFGEDWYATLDLTAQQWLAQNKL